MTDQEKRGKVIKGLECIVTSGNAGMRDNCAECIYPGGGDCLAPALRDALVLLKAQETSLEKVADDYGLTVDGVAFALEQYQTIICEITHGMMSKLTYRAYDVLQTAQERWCDTCELKEAQEPIKPKVFDIIGLPHYYECGNCNAMIAKGVKHCENCGRAVKWE